MGDTPSGTPVYADGAPAAEDEKAHIFCKADLSTVDMHPLFNDPTLRISDGDWEVDQGGLRSQAEDLPLLRMPAAL